MSTPRYRDPNYQQSYYQRVTKKKRETQRAQRTAKVRSGPKLQKHPDVVDMQLKLPDELEQFVRQQCKAIDYQMYFNQLVRNEMEKSS